MRSHADHVELCLPAAHKYGVASRSRAACGVDAQITRQRPSAPSRNPTIMPRWRMSMAVQSAACTPVALRSGCAAVPHRMRAFRLLGRHAIPCSQSRGEVGIVLSASSRLHDTCAPHTCVPHAPLKSACTARIGWIAHAHVYPSMSPAFDRIAWGMRSPAACALRPHALSSLLSHAVLIS